MKDHYISIGLTCFALGALAMWLALAYSSGRAMHGKRRDKL